ncbi:two pore calcium channel protein 1-like [Trifolium medium]|uniref:Two pore calcium channel protein 1-like n=1 Tax=Trifolium medium TaxID=97028 RepID=A0A392M5J6_9FABA|nr:two pore calcium channel protein 1-like [Trifolium medium]
MLIIFWLLRSSRWSILFFILFVLIGVYFVTNLILAVVYDSFKSELVKQVSEMDRMRRAMLEKAFNLLDTNCQSDATAMKAVISSDGTMHYAAMKAAIR